MATVSHRTRSANPENLKPSAAARTRSQANANLPTLTVGAGASPACRRFVAAFNRDVAELASAAGPDDGQWLSRVLVNLCGDVAEAAATVLRMHTRTASDSGPDPDAGPALDAQAEGAPAVLATLPAAPPDALDVAALARELVNRSGIAANEHRAITRFLAALGEAAKGHEFRHLAVAC